MSVEKDLLRDTLQQHRDVMLWKLEGLSEYDLRRPITPTGTNLLGLVKHLAGLEYGYLGGVFGRPGPEVLPWEEDGSIWDGADMWVPPDQSTAYITGLYRRACAHADQTIAELDLDAVGTVSWWAPGKQKATLLQLLLRMIGETARHAGHADVARELIDGAAGWKPGDDSVPEDRQAWVDRIEAAARAADPSL